MAKSNMLMPEMKDMTIDDVLALHMHIPLIHRDAITPLIKLENSSLRKRIECEIKESIDAWKKIYKTICLRDFYFDVPQNSIPPDLQTEIAETLSESTIMLLNEFHPDHAAKSANISEEDASGIYVKLGYMGMEHTINTERILGLFKKKTVMPLREHLFRIMNKPQKIKSTDLQRVFKFE